MPQHHLCRYSQLWQTLLAAPLAHNVIVNALQCMLWSIESHSYLSGNRTENGIGNIDQTTQGGMNDIARRHADQDEMAHFVCMAKRILGRNSSTKGVGNQLEWALYREGSERCFQIIHQPIHAVGHCCRIVTVSVSAHVGGNYTGSLAEITHLVEPLECASTIPMHKYKGACCLLRLYINDADAAGSLAMTRSTHIPRRETPIGDPDGASVQLNI